MKYPFETRGRFSIRKLSIGVCSVCLGFAILNAVHSHQTVLAQEGTTDAQPAVTAEFSPSDKPVNATTIPESTTPTRAAASESTTAIDDNAETTPLTAPTTTTNDSISDSQPSEVSSPVANDGSTDQAQPTSGAATTNEAPEVANASPTSTLEPAATSVTEAPTSETENQNTPVAENLVKNGDFTQTKAKTGTWTGEAATSWNNPWIPSNITADSKSKAQLAVVDGRLMISAPETFRTSIAQVLEVDASKKYEVSYEVETQNVEGAGVRVRFLPVDEKGATLKTPEGKTVDAPTTSYVNKTNTKTITQQVTFDPIVSRVKLEIFFETGTGTAYFDNITFKEYIKPQEEVKEAPQAETREVQLGLNKYYLPNLSDATYTVENPEIAEVRNQIITPKQTGSTKVTITKDEQTLGSFTLNVENHEADIYDQILQSWENVSLGNENYQADNPYMQEFLAKIESGVEESLAHWDNDVTNRESIFDDVTDFTKSANITTTYRRLEQFAQVLDNKSSKYYQNYDLAVKLKQGMEYLYKHVYNEQKEIVGNWWDYEIGTPRAVVDVLAYANAYFTQEEINRYIKPIDKFVADPTVIRSTTTIPVPAVGGNQTDLSKVTILSGALKQDSARIQEGADGLLTVLNFVKEGQGFYRDGSFIDHTDVAYTGAYGNVLMDGFSQILPMIANTSFALPAEKTAILYEWIDRAYFPIILNGELMDMTRGRSISRASAESHAAAIEALRGIVRIAQASDEAQKMHLLSAVKGRIGEDTFYVPYQNLKSYTDISLFEKLLNDATIPAVKPETFLHSFHNMDKFVYNNAENHFAIALSMYSDRTQNYEDMNNENRHGWYTSDGMVYLYNNDLTHYSEGYWPTVDPYKMPGTTELVTAREDGSGQVNLPSSFVGASKFDEKNAAVAMDFTNYNEELSARKAWFIFGDKIVMLTTNIQNKSSDASVTTIENRKLVPDKNTKIYVNGEEMTADKVMNSAVDTFYLETADPNQRIGYAFLTPLSLDIEKQVRTHSWSEINYGQPSDPVTNTFVTVTHTTQQNGENLAYVLMPNQDQEALNAAKDTVKVVVQNNDLQVVYDETSQTYGVIKYTDTPYELTDKVTLNQAGIYVIKKTSDGFDLSFAHPRDDAKFAMLEGSADEVSFKVLKTADEVDRTTKLHLILPTETTDSSTQTDNPVTADNGTQTDNPSTSDSGTQTENPSTSDSGTQTDNPSTSDSGTQTDNPSMSDNSTQTDNTSTSDNGTQTLPVVHVTYKFADGTLYQSFDLQFEKGAIVDASDLIMLPDNMNFADDFLYYEVQGNGLDTIQRVVEKTTTHQEIQTDNPSTSDSGTQTDNPSMSDNGTQTDNPSMSDNGAQTENPSMSDSGTQTDNPSTSDNGTQTENPSTSDSGTQTDNPSTSDNGTQTDNPSTSDSGTQTDNPSTSDSGTQTENPSTSDSGTQTDNPSTSDSGTQTENPSMSDNGTQTLPVVHVTYKFADGTLYQSFDLQFEKGAIVDASDLIMLPDNMNFADDFLYYEVQGNGLDIIQRVVEKTTTHQETQTDNPSTSDSGTQTDNPSTSDSGTQTDDPSTLDNGTQTELPKEEEKQSNKDNVKEQPKKELGSQAKRNKKAKEQSSVQSDAASVKRLPKTGNQADQALLLSGLASIGLSTGIFFKRKKEQ
ncbi:polysaccharide lyase family 8 super-sandwich domain-containing protein [Enterococcus cecorum]|uniref:polysaccharide lyase family 8 super-sandwich domain-containing protein n=2 Tax=Enterococcus cecorum TaxID=44008 RepID=UPI001FAB80F2|nr:polysaccharide lyase family 8 super-sandwich domain-containing protein [Enterococcus cecorum]MCJ0537643.1 YSIRK-type signal peptide-containing protein [Enterococcus cecorum]MCJ0545541.1 YSIRK-type signal peptide-containing protein [Enterococcus cecorum]MCJ0549892.1 YSIRK-type signal peptide-containing protein [Enterococcus cecorum]MCJ0568920.1 YSIRK-type signal peptide-containing protein [Enterococcus cecorum]